jgi:hypothetical protein
VDRRYFIAGINELSQYGLTTFMIKKIGINADLIRNWNDFHDLFSKTLGFPEFYGRNMDAWIDCMTYIDDKEAGMSKFWINKTDTLLIELTNSEEFKKACPDIHLALLECAAFVNKRRLDTRGQAMIAIALG